MARDDMQWHTFTDGERCHAMAYVYWWWEMSCNSICSLTTRYVSCYNMRKITTIWMLNQTQMVHRTSQHSATWQSEPKSARKEVRCRVQCRALYQGRLHYNELLHCCVWSCVSVCVCMHTFNHVRECILLCFVWKMFIHFCMFVCLFIYHLFVYWSTCTLHVFL